MAAKKLSVAEWLDLPDTTSIPERAAFSAQTAHAMHDLVTAVAKSSKFRKWRPETIRYRRADDSKPVERHYSAIEISEAWGISADLVRNIFKAEPGVLKFDRPATRTKRAYSTIRVPESVLKRVHTRLSSGG